MLRGSHQVADLGFDAPNEPKEEPSRALQSNVSCWNPSDQGPPVGPVSCPDGAPGGSCDPDVIFNTDTESDAIRFGGQMVGECDLFVVWYNGGSDGNPWSYGCCDL